MSAKVQILCIRYICSGRLENRAKIQSGPNCSSAAHDLIRIAGLCMIRLELRDPLIARNKRDLCVG